MRSKSPPVAAQAMGFCQESSDETAKRGKVLDQGHELLRLEMIREMGWARPDPFVFGPNQARFLGGGGGGGGGCGWGLGGGGYGCGCGFMGSGRDETVRRFLVSERKREREKERKRVCVGDQLKTKTR